MPTVSGTLSDIGLAPLTGLSPVLRFTPSSPAIDSSGRVFASEPVRVTPASDGSFSVELASTYSLTPRGTHWKVGVRWRHETTDGQGYSPVDYLPFKLFVSPAGGSIIDGIDEPSNEPYVYVGADVPNPAITGYQFQYNPETNDLYGRLS